MAAMLRSLTRQGRVLQILANVRPARSLVVPLLHQKASISTSQKNKDVGATVQPMEKSAELKKLTERFADTSVDKEENWTSYGFEPGDRDADWFQQHLILFFGVTVCFCWGCFIVKYMPDYMFQDWAKREAYLELERRERLGLPFVDPDYVKADQIELPTDEELGDQEIII